MATGSEIGLAEPSTVTKNIATVTQSWNGADRHQELLTIAGAESTLEIARVQATAPASTSMGLVVRIAGGPSSAADATFRINQGIGNSSAADRWRVLASNSSASDYSPIRIVDSSGTGYHGPANPLAVALTDSSNAVVKAADSANNAIRVNVVAGAASGSTNVTVSIPVSWANVAFSTAGHTTLTTVLSSAATVPYVSAFTAASTEQGPIMCAFTAGSTVIWPFVLWADGGVPAVAQAVPQSGFLFKGQANRPLEFRILSGSTGTVYLGVTYKQE